MDFDNLKYKFASPSGVCGWIIGLTNYFKKHTPFRTFGQFFVI